MSKFSRRRFLEIGAAVAGATLAPSTVLLSPKTLVASPRPVAAGDAWKPRGQFAYSRDRALKDLELSGADCRQKSRLQHLVDKPLTCDRDDGLFRIRQAHVSTFHCQAATLLRSIVFRQFHGSSSSSL